MRALVAYESRFGNTAAITYAVAESLADMFDVTVADVSTMPPASDMDLIVIGAAGTRVRRKRTRLFHRLAPETISQRWTGTCRSSRLPRVSSLVA